MVPGPWLLSNSYPPQAEIKGRQGCQCVSLAQEGEKKRNKTDCLPLGFDAARRTAPR